MPRALDSYKLIQFAVLFLLANLEDEVICDILNEDCKDYEVTDSDRSEIETALRDLHLDVTVAVISHREGQDAFIGSKKQVDEQVLEYVRQWWFEVSKRPMPKDWNKAVRYYFDNHPKGETCDYSHRYITIDIEA